jgi:hypothetical protein
LVYSALRANFLKIGVRVAKWAESSEKLSGVNFSSIKVVLPTKEGTPEGLREEGKPVELFPRMASDRTSYGAKLPLSCTPYKDKKTSYYEEYKNQKVPSGRSEPRTRT